MQFTFLWVIFLNFKDINIFGLVTLWNSLIFVTKMIVMKSLILDFIRINLFNLVYGPILITLVEDLSISVRNSEIYCYLFMGLVRIVCFR